MSDEGKQIITMKLDGEDYKNIYIRVRDRLIVWIAGLLAACLGVGGLAAYSTIQRVAEIGVEKYIATEHFKNNIERVALDKANNTQAKLVKLEADVEGIEKKIGTLARLPVAVGKNGLVFVAEDGQKYYIETGTVQDGETIKFKSQFNGSPTVILTVTGDGFAERVYKPGVPTVTKTEFTVQPTGFRKRTYSWVALGQ